MTSTTKSYMRVITLFTLCIFVLAGCARKPNNAAIVSAIQSKLAKSPSLNGYYVHVESRNGAVTLTGVVPNADAKQKIAAMVATVGKPSSFVDSLSVAVPGPVPLVPSDAAIESFIRQEFAMDPSLAKIEVTSNGGAVTLKGNVANAVARTQAEKLAEHIGGVQSVDDQLQVTASNALKQRVSVQPRLAVTLKATPSLITPGKSALLTWSAHDAKSLDLEPGVGSVKAEGSRTVSPRTSTTYTLIAVGDGGRATATAHVIVWNAVPPPRITASVFPPHIKKGQSARLTWQSQDANAVDIEPGVGQVGPNGSMSVAPAQSTQYALTATGQGGRQATTTFLTVAAPPQPAVVSIPAGTSMEVLMVDPVDSGSNQPNDIVRASLAAPIQVNDRLTLPEGTEIDLRVFEVFPGGSSGRESQVRLVLDHLVYEGKSYSLASTDFDVFGLSRNKRRAEVSGGITRGQQVHIAPGARIGFQLTQPVGIVLPAGHVRDR